MQRETNRQLKLQYGNDIKIFEQTIPRTESLAETASEGVSIFAYDGKAKGQTVTENWFRRC